jgi:hypothetical protein
MYLYLATPGELLVAAVPAAAAAAASSVGADRERDACRDLYVLRRYVLRDDARIIVTVIRCVSSVRRGSRRRLSACEIECAENSCWKFKFANSLFVILFLFTEAART